MTRQTIQLGWLPRPRITQTTEEGYGQIYVGAVNWLLMFVTLGLTVGFGKSGNLASAYGVAVAATMLMTSVLLFTAMREISGWSIIAASAVTGAFVVVDANFLAANLAKLLEGGYVQLVLAAVVYFLMWTWRHGIQLTRERLVAQQTPLSDFARILESGLVAHAPGAALFLTRTPNGTPLVLSWHVARNRSLHERVLALTLITEQTARAPKLGADIGLDDVTYYVGHETIAPRDGRTGPSRSIVSLFNAIARNGIRLADVLGLPRSQVVAIGRKVLI